MVTTRDMSDRHEDDLVAVLGGRKTKGSGNQWHNPMDGRMNGRTQHYAFAWDGKSTFGKSVGVSLQMWEKAKEQAFPLKPLLPLRWYATERLEVAQDLVVLDLHTFVLLLADANTWHAVQEQGCLNGNHDFTDGASHFVSTCSICEASAYDQPGAES